MAEIKSYKVHGCPGMLQYEPCNHISGKSDQDGLHCPVCAEIKTAEDKQGEEVLEILSNYIGGMAIAPVLKDAIMLSVRQAYKERYE